MRTLTPARTRRYRRGMRLSLACAFAASLLFTGCGDDGEEENYDNLPDCVTDHVEEGLTEAQAIAHCLVDYDFHPELADQAACVTYVSENGGYADSRDEACTIYFDETGA